MIGNDAGPVRVLINTVGSTRHWMGLRMVDRHGRDALGARVTITRGDGKVLVRRARADGSYASASDPRVLIGLGDSTDSSTVRVHWPSGKTDEWRSLPIDRYTTLKEGGSR